MKETKKIEDIAHSLAQVGPVGGGGTSGGSEVLAPFAQELFEFLAAEFGEGGGKGGVQPSGNILRDGELSRTDVKCEKPFGNASTHDDGHGAFDIFLKLLVFEENRQTVGKIASLMFLFFALGQGGLSVGLERSA